MTNVYYQEHKEERKAKSRKYYHSHKEERKAYREAHKEEIKAYREEHKEERKAYLKAYNEVHKEERKAYYKSYMKTYNKTNTNSSGIQKNSIRCMSSEYLFNTLKHTKLKGYEIHHCFGYENHRAFIYIPKELHLQIHQYLRNNGINADSNHFTQIAHLINVWNGYTYIKV